MVNEIIYLSKARKEFDETIDYYEKRSTGLGVRFELCVKQTLETISMYPDRYPKQNLFFRQALVNEFPFLIIYRYYKNKNLIVLHSIFHTSQNPKNKYRK